MLKRSLAHTNCRLFIAHVPQPAGRRYHAEPAPVESAISLTSCTRVCCWCSSFQCNNVPILRSSQVDAGRLDDELQNMLQEQLAVTTAYLHPVSGSCSMGSLPPTLPDLHITLQTVLDPSSGRTHTCMLWPARSPAVQYWLLAGACSPLRSTSLVFSSRVWGTDCVKLMRLPADWRNRGQASRNGFHTCEQRMSGRCRTGIFCLLFACC